MLVLTTLGLAPTISGKRPKYYLSESPKRLWCYRKPSQRHHLQFGCVLLSFKSPWHIFYRKNTKIPSLRKLQALKLGTPQAQRSHQLMLIGDTWERRERSFINFQDVHPLIWSYSHIWIQDCFRDGCDGLLHQRILNDCWLRFFFFWIVCNCVFVCDVMCMYILYMFWICFVTLHNIAWLMMLLAGDASLRSAFLRRFSGKNQDQNIHQFQFPTSKRHVIISLEGLLELKTSSEAHVGWDTLRWQENTPWN